MRVGRMVFRTTMKASFMDDHNDAGATGTAQGNGADTMPSIGIISQYVKDLSFENPTSPAIYQNQTPPRVDVQFNIGATQVGDEVHEVVLTIDARSDAGEGCRRVQSPNVL